MLKIDICNGILEVKETIYHHTKTVIHYWYYDISLWIRSIKGERNEIPIQKMTESEIDWVKKYYLPNAKVHTPILERKE